MSSEIMRFQMDPYHFSCFIHNFSPCRIGYWEYPLVRSNPFPGYVFLEAVCNLLRDEDGFTFLAAFGGSESELSVLDVIGGQFQYFADPHPSAGHQLKNQPAPGFDSSTTSFSRMAQRMGPGGRYSFFSTGVSQGLRKLASRFWVMKLKKEVSWEYRMRLVNWLVL